MNTVSPGGRLNRDTQEPQAFLCPHGVNMNDCPTCETEDYEMMRKNAEFGEDGTTDDGTRCAPGAP
jgi:hypothetical protein